MTSEAITGGHELPDLRAGGSSPVAVPTATRAHSRDHDRIIYGDKDEAGENAHLEPLRALMPSGPNLAQTKRAAQLDTRYNQTRAPKPHAPKPARRGAPEYNWVTICHPATGGTTLCTSMMVDDAVRIALMDLNDETRADGAIPNIPMKPSRSPMT